MERGLKLEQLYNTQTLTHTPSPTSTPLRAHTSCSTQPRLSLNPGSGGGQAQSL